MPLTEEQTKRLAELRAKQSMGAKSPAAPAPTGLTPEQKTRLAELRSKKAQTGIVSEPVTGDELFSRWTAENLSSGEVVPTEPTFFQSLWSKAPQMTGGTIGGAIGWREAQRNLPPTIDPRLGWAISLGAAGLGAGIGAMGGKGWQQYYKMKTDLPNTKPRELKDLYIEQLWAGLEEGISEITGRGITAGISRISKPFLRRFPILSPFKKTIAPGAEEASELLEKYGTHLTAGQAVQSRTMDLIEDVAEGSWLGGGRLYKLKRIAQPQAIYRVFDDTLDDFAKQVGKRLTPEEVGTTLLDTINREDKTFRTASRALYGHVDNVIKRAGGNADIVDLTKLKKYATYQLSKRAQIAESQTGRTILEKILQHPDKVNFKQGTSIRSQLLLLERFTSETKDVAMGTIKQAVKLTDNAIEQGGKSLRGDAFGLWRSANLFHRTGKEKFNTQIIKGLSKTLKDNPQRFVNMIYRPEASKGLKNLYSVIDDETKTALKYGLVQNLINQSADKTGQSVVAIDRAGKTLSPVVGRTFLNNLDELGEEVLKTTFSEAELSSLRLAGRAAELTQTAGFGKGGRMLVTLSQAGIVLGLASFEPTRPGAAPILFGPAVAARMMTNPTTAKLLSVGLKTLPESPKAAALATRILREARKYQIEEQKQQKQRRYEEWEEQERQQYRR